MLPSKDFFHSLDLFAKIPSSLRLRENRTVHSGGLKGLTLREFDNFPFDPVRQTGFKQEMNMALKLNGISSCKATILSIGNDLELLRTRQMVLESVGYKVCSVPSRGVVESDEIQLADLALICHSVENAPATTIACALRNMHPPIPILRLIKVYWGQESIFDETLALSADPKNLLNKINEMLAGKRVGGR
jgi:hypothetical protein